jgi:hypothetical protein
LSIRQRLTSLVLLSVVTLKIKLRVDRRLVVMLREELDPTVCLKITSWYNQELNISHHNLQLFPQFRLLINTEMFSLQHRTLKFSS